MSLSRCYLSIDTCRSLFLSMQSPNWKLHTLILYQCHISKSDQTVLGTINEGTLESLDISGPWSVLDEMIPAIHPFTQLFTLKLCFKTVECGFDTFGLEIIEKIHLCCPLLSTLVIHVDCDSSFLLPLSIPRFLGSQQNNLHTLLLKSCTLSSDVTRSLIHSLQSPHCKLYKLALHYCTIPTTDHTQLTTAIVSSTTITHLLFIDRNIDTPSLTALASGLKHNTTIQQLAVDKPYSFFTEDQFQVLIGAVDSSAVKKLWLYDYSEYKRCFSDYTLSRNNVEIECYSNISDWFNKW